MTQERNTLQYSHRIWKSPKLVRLTKMCLNETCCRVHTGKHLSDNFPMQNGLKQGEDLKPSLFNFASEYAIRNDEFGESDQ
jgi:hypothetical protein